MSTSECMKDELKYVAKNEEERALKNHRSDSLTLLLYLILLILSVLTTWLFKHRRFKFVHETGLSMIYGLFAGLVIRYLLSPSSFSTSTVSLSVRNVSCGEQLPPERLYLTIPVHYTREDSKSINSTTDNSLIYQYTLLQQVKESNNRKSVELEEKVTFNSEIFFNILLPPIIFSAGYSMKRKHFFRNFGAIVTFAFVGTLLASVLTGVICFGTSLLFSSLRDIVSFSDCLLFGAILSATDPVTVLAIFNDLSVDVTLYALVFGESVLNDAVAIVLSQSIEQYSSITDGAHRAKAFAVAIGNFAAVFGGAFAIGTAVGCLTALLTKFTHVRDHPLLETALFTLMSYGTFLLSEAIGFTGIVAVLFCGITQAHYTYNNLSEESQIWTKEFFELLNFLAENFVFTYIGVSLFTFQQHYWHAGFILGTIIAIILARAVNIYPLSFLLNFGRSEPISGNKQHMLMFSGLRGAMAFSLAIRNVSSPVRCLFLSTTLVVVMVTVIICGGFTTPMLQLLKIKVNVPTGTSALPPIASSSTRSKRVHSIGEDSENYSLDADTVGLADPLDNESRPRKSFVARHWGNFDNNILKPLLTHSGPLLSETLPSCCLGLASFLTTEEQLLRCTSAPQPIHQELADTDNYSSPSRKITKPSTRSGFSYRRSSLMDDSTPGFTGYSNEENDGDGGFVPHKDSALVLQVTSDNAPIVDHSY